MLNDHLLISITLNDHPTKGAETELQSATLQVKILFEL